jgi:hypothetical protein
MAKSQDKFTMVYNLAGLGVAVVLVGYVGATLFRDTREPPCSRRYPAAWQYSLADAGGAPLTPIELQARAGAHQRHVLDNLTVVAVANGPAPHALEVTLARGGEFRDMPTTAGGVGYAWTVPQLAEATRVCLAYSVEIPESFSFAPAGRLPGLFGGEPIDTSEFVKDKLPAAFVTRPLWKGDGLAGVVARVPVEQGTLGFDLDDATFARGSWTKIEQEIVLNHPGAADGIYRVWIDGKLKSGNTQVTWRLDDSVHLGGVVGDVSYDGPLPQLEPNKTATLRFTPFELSWR